MLNTTYKLKYIFAFSWLAITMALSVWWVYFVNKIIAGLETGEVDWATELPKMKNMVFWEGITLIILILVGAVPLIYLIYSEELNNRKIRQFFAQFSHDLKTSMASLKLQAQILQEDKGGAAVDRLLGDTERLHLQLENSLFLAKESAPTVFMESIEWKPWLDGLKLSWPHLEISVDGDIRSIWADRRAIEGIFNNLCHNSLIHGEATQLKIEISEGDLVEVKVSDNGKGFSGNIKELSHPFVRHNASSGSGMGLFIVRELMTSMGGELVMPEALGDDGFFVRLHFKKESA